MQASVLVTRCGSIQCRNFSSSKSYIRTCQFDGNQCRVLMNAIHLEHVIRWSQHHLLAICQCHRLQHVHHLRDVGHLHSIRVVVENVEIDCSDDGIAHCVLLIEGAEVFA